MKSRSLIILFLIIGIIGTMSILYAYQLPHYSLEIQGMKDTYYVGEKYSFYYTLSGYGHTCGTWLVWYPDQKGDVIPKGEVIDCSRPTNKEFSFNSEKFTSIMPDTAGIYNVTVSVSKIKESTVFEFTVISTESSLQEPSPLPVKTQCKPGIPPFTSDYYLDKELCKWKLIPEPIINEAIPYVWNAYLQKRQMDFSPKEVSYWNTAEGWDDEKENKVCSPLILSDGTELYISSTFTVEPFKIIDTVISETQFDDCYKIWRTDTLLVEPSPKLGAWLENYWEKENEK